jgi:recombination protein RecT
MAEPSKTNLPAGTQKPAAPANAPKTAIDILNSAAMKNELVKALPKILSIDRFMRCLFSNFSRVPDLKLCDKTSILGAAMTAAQLGLEIDPVLGRAYLLPYNDKKKGKVAQLIIGYKGYVDLAYRSGQVASIQAEVVYEKDVFEYAYGLHPKLMHVPTDNEQRGPLKFAYCVVTLSNGGQIWRVLNKAEIYLHRDFSRSKDSDYSPWKTSEAEMWRKTAIRALAPLMPLSPELRQAAAAEETAEIGGEISSFSDLLDTPAEVTDADNKPADSQGMAAAAETGKAGE